MAILSKSRRGKTVIDLSGPDGNAFVLLGIADKLARQLGMTPNERDAIRAEMIKSDYNNLIESFDKRFGEYVDLQK